MGGEDGGTVKGQSWQEPVSDDGDIIKRCRRQNTPAERVSLAPCHFSPGFFSEKQNHGEAVGGRAEDEECVCLCACVRILDV